MNPDDAKKLWCPFATSRVVQCRSGDERLFQAMICGPTTTDRPETTCLASNCMAWRWESKPFDNAQPGETGMAAGSGYCGLAGKP